MNLSQLYCKLYSTQWLYYITQNLPILIYFVDFLNNCKKNTITYLKISMNVNSTYKKNNFKKIY